MKAKKRLMSKIGFLALYATSETGSRYNLLFQLFESMGCEIDPRLQKYRAKKKHIKTFDCYTCTKIGNFVYFSINGQSVFASRYKEVTKVTNPKA